MATQTGSRHSSKWGEMESATVAFDVELMRSD